MCYSFFGDSMDQNIEFVLKNLTSKGYKAYVVGGFVRDYLMLNEISNDVDITTNAPCSVITELFSSYDPKVFLYDTVKFKMGKFNFDLAHFRCEKLVGENLDVNFTEDLFEDSLRRDFTINAIYMDESLQCIDYHSGINDLNNKILRFIGDPVTRLNEDPSRILRYIYFLVKFDLKYIDTDFIKVKNNATCYLNRCSLYDINKYFVKMLDTNKIKEIKHILLELNIADFFFDNIDSSSAIDISLFLIESKYRFISQLPNRYKNLR